MPRILIAAVVLAPLYAWELHVPCTTDHPTLKKLEALPSVRDYSISFEPRIGPLRAPAERHPDDLHLPFLDQMDEKRTRLRPHPKPERVQSGLVGVARDRARGANDPYPSASGRAHRRADARFDDAPYRNGQPFLQVGQRRGRSGVAGNDNAPNAEGIENLAISCANRDTISLGLRP